LARREEEFVEIQALKLLLTENDLNQLVSRALTDVQPVRDVSVRLLPEGIGVSGIYPTALMKVRFDTLWQPFVRDGRLAARLADLKVVGIGGGLVRKVLLGILGDAARLEDALKVEDDTVLFDLDRILARNGLPVRTNLTAVQCGAGTLLLVCLAPDG
jgi:hypothetical protein